EFGPCAKKNTLHSGHREIENFSNLLVAKLLVSAQHERHSLSFRELKNRTLDRSLKLDFQQRRVRRRLCLIFERSLLCAGFRLERNMRVPLGSAQLIENKITRYF